MKLKHKQGTTTIDDRSIEARKIRQGHEWSFVGGKIMIGAKTGFDLDKFSKKLENKTATLGDIQEYLLSVVK